VSSAAIVLLAVVAFIVGFVCACFFVRAVIHEEAVEVGAAEFYIDEQRNKAFRWLKDGKPAAK
jgi:hypothetical protein